MELASHRLLDWVCWDRSVAFVYLFLLFCFCRRIGKKKKTKQNKTKQEQKASDKDNVMQVLLFQSPFSACLSCAWWCGWGGRLGKVRMWDGVGGHFQGKQHGILSFAWRGRRVFHFLILFVFLLGFFCCFFLFFCFCCLLTVARSRVLDLQQHPHWTSSLLHGTFTGICGVVAGTHRLVCPALWTGLIAQRAATPAHPSIPQTLFPRAALDVLTRLGL